MKGKNDAPFPPHFPEDDTRFPTDWVFCNTKLLEKEIAWSSQIQEHRATYLTTLNSMAWQWRDLRPQNTLEEWYRLHSLSDV